MTDSLLFAIGCGVTFLSLAGVYVYLRYQLACRVHRVHLHQMEQLRQASLGRDNDSPPMEEPFVRVV